jgi:hypothetical protein
MLTTTTKRVLENFLTPDGTKLKPTIFYSKNRKAYYLFTCPVSEYNFSVGCKTEVLEVTESKSYILMQASRQSAKRLAEAEKLAGIIITDLKNGTR